MQNSKQRVQLDLSVEQAQTLSQALDLYTRVGLGQLEQIDDLVRMGVIPCGPQHEGEILFEPIATQAKVLKGLLGFSAHGSWSIGADSVPIGSKRAYEVKKALDRELAMARDPEPEFKGVNYDGVTVRYTRDELPVVRIVKPDGWRKIESEPSNLSKRSSRRQEP